MKFSLGFVFCAALSALPGTAPAQVLSAHLLVPSPGPLPEAPMPMAFSTSGVQTSASPATPGSGAQSAVPPASTRSPQSATPTPSTPSVTREDEFKAEEQQRMLGVIPNFNTVNSGDAPPLTKGEKFHLWFKSSTDPFVFVTAGIDAGVEQADNSYPGYHQGFEGFAKRYGASYADTVDGNLWGNAILPVLLHQDPRYFRLGHGTFKYRLWWAALSTVRCKGDNGRWEPNYSNVGGNLIAGAISNLYYPASDRGTGLIFERAFTVTAEGALGSLAYEFYPDVISYYKRRHQQRQLQKAGMTSTSSGSAATP